jgi:opacity protein-like surface antigen
VSPRVHESSWVRVLFVGFALVLAARPASGQIIRAERWSVTPLVGVSFGGDINGSAMSIGAAGAYDWSTNLGFEGELTIHPNIAGFPTGLDWRVVTFTANVVYHFDIEQIAPYATFGVGLARSRLDFDLLDLDESSTNFTSNFGGGVKAPVAERLLLRGDLRYFAGNDRAPDHWRFYGGLTFLLGQ